MNKPKRGYRLFPPDELDNFILAHYRSMSDEQIAIRMRCKLELVRFRRRDKMGLIRPKDVFRCKKRLNVAA